ncbi:Gfo/Idh/MocA family oxidoreductase [Roseisolibacter sp. H3M3-2]|uniref:Gfo/Idh/MocA family protein n=1 Tax=Roseisolibacter sp. H3M3-2 TaxID=3031323 RepID=UPI0023DA90F3|nr:Gfo/Idh/MocA family oxidoreductase [Roseisolibacter sp. H3M3-2]MDF1505682.1 Gfo/Idh/MocA family oxidoreductase [Roseisolibacter sp. H3M3-2]
MSEPLRLAVAGCGAIAQLAHLPVLSKMRGVRLVALCDNDAARARALADRFDVPDVFTDLEELLESDVVDGLIVATPNHLHEPHVLSALKAGVDVLCERPLALTTRGVERVLAAAQKGGRRVLVGNNHRFRSDVQALARFVGTGELGRIVGVRAGAYAPRAPQGWRQRRAEAGGGAFLEQGFNLLDLAMWLANFAEPTRLSAIMTRGRGANAVEETMLVALELEGDVSVGIDVSWAYVGERERSWFEVLGTRGSARLAPLRVVKELNGRPVDVSPGGASARDSAFLQSYRAQLAHFVAVLRGETPYEPPSDQVTVARLLETIYRAADDRKEIRL